MKENEIINLKLKRLEENNMVILMLSIIIGLIIVVFAVQNSAVVPVQFFIWSTELPLVLVIFGAVFAGSLLMFSLALWRDFRKRMGIGSKRIEVKKEKEPVNIPVAESDRELIGDKK